MNTRKFQPVKILIIVYCISLIALASRDFKYIYIEQQAYFYFNFLAPLLIAIITLLAYILKQQRLLFYRSLEVKKYRVFDLVFVIMLEGVYIFSLVMVWHSVEVITRTNSIVYSLISAISNSMFLIYFILWTLKFRLRRSVTNNTINKTASVVKAKTKKIDFARITELLGLSADVIFTEIENGYVFIIPEEHIYADFFERIKVVYDDAFRGISLVLKLKSDSLLSLDIRKRDSIFSNKKNEFSISPLSNVYTLNSQTPEIWENLLSDPVFQQSLLLLRPYFEYFSLKGAYVEALVYSDTSIVKLIEWVMEMNPSMELMSKNINSSDADILLCYNCQDPFDPLEETCTKCGSARPRCIVCFQDLKPVEDDDVVELPCCGIYAHKDHIMTWLEKEAICPNCHGSLTRWMNQNKINRGF